MQEPQLTRWPVPRGVPPGARVLMRAPPAIRLGLVRAALRRPASSRLRRRVIANALRVGFHLLNQRDDRGAEEQILRWYDPGCEIHIGPGFALDAQSVYAGHPGYRAMLGLWDEAGALSFSAREVLDMGGECVSVLVAVTLTGSGSGVEAPAQSVLTYTFGRGLIVRQDIRADGWEHGPAELAAALRRSAPRPTARAGR